MNKPYNNNPELSAMKEDIADRSYNVKVKGWLVTAATVAGAAALGALALPAIGILGGSAVMGALVGGAAGFALGGTVADLATMKDREKLKIDQEMVDSYMSGKNYWGEGYREEVAEKGYSLGGPHPGSIPGGGPGERGL